VKKILTLLFFSFLLFQALNAQDEKRLALVIGNANYERGELKNPVNDARLIKSTLDSLNFEVIYGENLSTRREILSLIEEFEEKRGEYNVGFIYYAGHGIQINDQNYLLPTKEVFEKESHVINYAVSVQTLLRSITSRSNEANIIVLDACRDNPYESNWNMTRSLKGNGLAKIPPPTGSLIAFSTDSGQTAPDGDGKNSIYSLSLSKNMLIEGLDILEVFTRVRAEVLEKSNGEQTTVDENKLIGKLVLKSKNFERDLDFAYSLIYDKDEYLEALKVLEPIIDLEPKNLRARDLRQEVYYFLEEYEKALNELDQMILIDSIRVETYFDKGYAFEKLDKISEAEKMFKKAVEFSENDVNWGVATNFVIANFYSDIERFKDAENYYQKSIEFGYKNNIETYRLDALWGLCLVYQNGIMDYEKAISKYEKILEIDSDLSFVKENGYHIYGNMGRIYQYGLYESEKAIEYYLKQHQLYETISIEVGETYSRDESYSDIIDYYASIDDKKMVLDYVNEAIEELDNPIHYLLYRAKTFNHDDFKAFESDILKAISMDENDPELYYELANKYNIQENYADALSNFLKVLDLDVDDYYKSEAYLYSIIAEILFFYGNDQEKAFEFFEKEIEVTNDKAQAYMDRGYIFEEMGDFESAIKDYDKGIKIDPDDSDFYEYRGDLYYYKLKDYEKALNDYLFANDLETTTYLTYMIADCYNFLLDENNEISIKEYALNAIKFYNKTLEMDEEYAKFYPLYNNMGSIYENVYEDYEMASKLYAKNIEISPEDSKSYFNYADIMEEKFKDFQAAITMYERIKKIDPINPQPDFRLGLLYYNKLEDFYKAALHWNMSAKLESVPLTHYNLGLALNKTRDYEKALFNWLKAAEMSNKDEYKNFAKENYLYVNIGSLYEETFNDYEKALEYYDLELKADNSSYFGLKRNALLLEKMNNFQEAITFFNRLVELDDDSIEPFLLRSNFYEFSKNNLELAYNDIKNASNVFIQNPDYEQIDGYTSNKILHKESQFFFRQKNYTKALEVYLNVENSNPSKDFFDTVDLYSEIADVYVELKNYSKALEYYNKELELYPKYVYTIQKKADLYAFHIKDSVSAEKWYQMGLEIEPDNNNLNLSYINFLYVNNKYDEVLKLAKIATERDEKDPQGHYVRALVYKNLSNPFLELTELNKCIDKIIDYTPEGYYISDTDGSILDLSEVFISRAVLFKSVNDSNSYCSGLNDALNYTDSKAQQNRIKQMINESCE